jgi:hypothetical protein
VSSAWDAERIELLRALQRMGDAGRAEGVPTDQLAKGFYPVLEHLRLLDIDVVLVVGPRGAGKTQISRLLNDEKISRTLVRLAPRVLVPANARWMPGYPAGRDVFDGNALRHFVDEKGKDTALLRDVWLAYLLRRLKRELAPESQQHLAELSR